MSVERTPGRAFSGRAGRVPLGGGVCVAVIV